MAKLYFYYSAMNAGKSTTLLQSSYNYNERGMETLLFTAALDTRDGEGIISSRIGLKAPAIKFDKDFDFMDHVANIMAGSKHHLACIMIDEAQFLTKTQVYQLTEIVDNLKIPVLAYGLRTDFLSEPFDGSLYLLAWADELIELKTICHCGSKATMNLRKDKDGQAVSTGDQIDIGGNEKYTSLCRVHFKEALDEARNHHRKQAIKDISATA